MLPDAVFFTPGLTVYIVGRVSVAAVLPPGYQGSSQPTRSLTLSRVEKRSLNVLACITRS